MNISKKMGPGRLNEKRRLPNFIQNSGGSSSLEFPQSEADLTLIFVDCILIRKEELFPSIELQFFKRHPIDIQYSTSKKKTLAPPLHFSDLLAILEGGSSKSSKLHILMLIAANSMNYESKKKAGG